MGPDTLAPLIPVTAIIVWGVVKVVKIRAQSLQAGLGPDAAGRLEALENEVGALRQELSEAHERLDFAERLLVKGPETRQP
jgi:hypothetical protein